MEVKRYRKKPVVVEAVQWTGNNSKEVSDFLKTEGKFLISRRGRHRGDPVMACFKTPEGEKRASPGDMIIKGVDGEFYPCKSNIFDVTYEEGESEDHCEYCQEPNKYIQDLRGDEKAHHLTAKIERKGIWVSFVVDGQRVGEWIDIEYCPICKRNLSEKETSDV